MKTLTVLISVALLQGATLAGGDSETDPVYDYNITGEGVDLHFKVVREPTFPESLRSKGVSQGNVTVQVEIDYLGELRDWLVTRASNLGFAESVDKVIRQWKFSSPMWKGKPISIIASIQINFRSQGDVVSFDITASLAETMMGQSGLKAFDAVELVDLDDLDAYPEAIKIVDPIVPKYLMNKNGDKLGVFRFYIDTEGRVRLPHVDRVEGKVDVRLLEAAQDALEQWQFKPPTSRGRKVIVEVAQPFTFNAES